MTWSCPCDFHPSIHPSILIIIIIITSSSSSHPANPSLLPPRSHSKSIRLRELRKSAQKSRDPEIQIPERQPKTTTPSLTHSLTTSCSISLTRGTRVSCKPQNAATFSICESINVSSRKSPSQVNQRCKMARKLTHCCTVSTSSNDTPIRLVPLKCHPVSRGRFCIMIPPSTTSSVSTASRMLWSER